MNWTGGRLQTSRHTGTSLSALQKAHFAKARTRLQNGPPTTSPLNFPVFEIAKDEGQGLPKYASLLAPEVRKIRTQRTLEEYHNTAPLAKRLTSIRRRSHDYARPFQPHGQRHRSRISSHSHTLTRHPRTVTAKIESNPNCLYGMAQEHSPEQSLEAKRRELLQRQDWVGAAVSKLLKMEFLEDKKCDRIGKRRRLREDENEFCRGLRYRTPVPATDERANIDSRRLPPCHHRHDTISVRVGTSIHGSQRTCERRDLTSQQSGQSDLSDSMLLDAKEVTRRHHHCSRVPTPLIPEKDVSADAPSSLATEAGMATCRRTVPPLSSLGSERNDHMTPVLFLPSACSSRRNAAVRPENINSSNSVAAIHAKAAPQPNSKPYSDRKAGSAETLGRLIFTSSTSSTWSSTPSATVELASRMNTGVNGSGTVPRADSEVENETNDACWKKFLNISSSSVINQHIDTSPLSKATLQGLAASRNDTMAGTALALAAPENEDSKNNFLPRPTTAHPNPKYARDLELIESRNKVVLNAEYGGANNASCFRDEDSVWREFVFGDEMDAGNSNTYEEVGHRTVVSRSRYQPCASSVVVQASSEEVVATISTSPSSGVSPSSNSYLVPALPRMVETSSPDPLNHLESSSRSIDQKRTRRSPGPKLLFKAGALCWEAGYGRRHHIPYSPSASQQQKAARRWDCRYLGNSTARDSKLRAVWNGSGAARTC